MTEQTLHTAGITGVGMSFPERILSNEDLEKMVDTNDQWIVERTGIRERHLVEPGTGASVHGAKAAAAAMADAGLRPEDIDLIVVPTVTPDMLFPSTCCLIQKELGLVNAWGYDLLAACSGFVFALQTARAQVQAGGVRRALVVGSEVMSAITDYTDRNTCILFGDGAGAVVVERVAPERGGILDNIHHIDGTGAHLLKMDGGGSLCPPTHESIDAKKHFIWQNGREVFKYAVKGMQAVTQEILDRHGLKGEDLKLFVAHQANLRIIESVGKRLGLRDEQVMVTIDRFGNTTSASIPSALRVAKDEGRLTEGDLVLLCSFGAGFTWGATLVRWTA